MDEITEKEVEQLKKFETFRRLVQAIILRRFWVPLLAFALAFVACYTAVRARALKADRFEARAVLLFHPRGSEYVKAVDQKELFQILFRRSMKDKLAERLAGAKATDGFRRELYRTVEFRKDDHQPGVFNAIVWANTAERAIERANEFANLCLAEYADYRRADLKHWLATTETRRKELLDRMAALDKEEDDLTESTRLPQPRAELERMNESLSQQKLALADANIKLTKEESQLKKLRTAFEKIPKGVAANADALKRFLADFDKIDAEIVEAEALYTEKNPRMIVVRERRAALLARYEAFCKMRGINPADVADLDQIETMTDEIKAAEAKVDVARETCEAMEREIARTMKSVNHLQEIIPSYDRIRHRRETLQQSLTEVEDAVSDIHYLQASIENDLGLIEPVNSADETPPIGKKKFVFVLMAAAVFAGLASVAFVLFDVLCGRVHDLRELTFHSELEVLGALPPSPLDFASEQDQKKVLDGIYYKLHSSIDNSRMMVVARLPGAEFSRELHYELDWNCAMSGKRLLRIEIVSALDFTMTDEMTMLGGGVVLKGQSAFFPVQNVAHLSPGEMMLLENDVKKLDEEYDLFVLGCRQPLTHDSVYFDQMQKFCDISVVFVGARKTPRANLRHMIQRQKKIGKPMFVILSGERKMDLVRKGI